MFLTFVLKNVFLTQRHLLVKSELIVSRKMMRPSSLICGAARDMALEIRQPAVAGVAPVKAIWRDSAEY